MFLSVCISPLSLRDADEASPVLPGIALQAIAGLRLTEAFRLQWSSGDLESGLVTIEGQVKEGDSVKRGPLLDFAVDILRRTRRSGDRILSDYTHYANYGKAVSRCLVRWKSDLGLEPKGLRRTLESEAARRGWAG